MQCNGLTSSMRARLTAADSPSTIQPAVTVAQRRVLITLAVLVVYRIGFMIPVPGLCPEFLSSNRDHGAFVGLASAFTAGAIGQTSIVALGLLPYVVASLAFWVVSPAARTAKRSELESWMRRAVLPIAATIAAFVHFGVFARHPEMIEASMRGSPALLCALVVLSLTAASVFVMRLAELIGEHGVGHGALVIIAAGMLARVPHALNALPPDEFWPTMLVMIGNWLVVVVLVVGVGKALRRA